MPNRLALSTVFALSACLPSLAQQSYQLTRLDAPGAGLVSQAASINSLGEVCVWTGPDADAGDAWILGPGAPRYLALLAGASASLPTRLFDSGRVVGWSGPTLTAARPLLWSAGGLPQELRTPAGATSAVALDANGSGWIVGYSSTQAQLANRPVAWVQRVAIPLDLPNGLGQGEATAINARGTIVGYAWPTGFHVYEGWVRDGLGTPHLIPKFPGHAENRLHDVNSSGLAVGDSYPTQFTSQGLFYDCATQQMTIVSPPHDHSGMSLVSVNRSGRAVGVLIAGSSIEAVVAEGSTATHLDDLLDASGAGWTMLFPGGINDAGWIACTAIDPQGQLAACLLTPVNPLDNGQALGFANPSHRQSCRGQSWSPGQSRKIQDAVERATQGRGFLGHIR